MNSQNQETLPQGETQSLGTSKAFRALVEETNIAESLEENELSQIGEDCRVVRSGKIVLNSG